MEKNGIIIFIKSVKISSFPWLKSGRLLRVRYGKKNVLGKIVGNLDFVGNEQDLSLSFYCYRTLPQVISFEAVFLQSTPGQLEVLRKNILKLF